LTADSAGRVETASRLEYDVELHLGRQYHDRRLRRFNLGTTLLTGRAPLPSARRNWRLISRPPSTRTPLCQQLFPQLRTVDPRHRYSQRAGDGGNSYATTVANFAGFAWVTGTLAAAQRALWCNRTCILPSTRLAHHASCSDFVVYPTGTAGATGAASIVAFSNLYSGCSGTVPSVDWAYNTGGMVTTSPCPPWMAHKWCSFR